MDGWIKLHRKLVKNKIWRHDITAWHVFEVLLLSVDRETGEWSGGRFTLAALSGMKPTTTYQALKRLEKAKMVTLRSNNKYTSITICNWDKYQGNNDSTSDNKMTTKRQQNDTITISKNKELRTIVRTIGKPTYGNAEVNKVVEEFEKQFGYIMPLKKANRIAASNLVKRYGVEKTLSAIAYAASIRDEPYQVTIADLRDLWAKMPKLVIAYTKSNNGMVVIKED